jgi:hypothetical protein
MKLLCALAVVFGLAIAPQASAHHNGSARDGGGLSNATVLIVRHAEEAEAGPGLSPAGEARAHGYARYFRPFRLGAESLRVDTLIAAADSRVSQRSRLTLEPLSHISGIAIQQPYADRHVKGLANWLRRGPSNRTILIAWHHGELPGLISELGGDPQTLLGRRHWPSHVYDWVVVLRFDRNGAIMPQSSRLIHEPVLLQ